MKSVIILLIACYVLIMTGLYFVQEKLLFFPTKLSKQFQFTFEHAYLEKDIEVGENTQINTVLFKSKESQGVVLFLHGNGGSIQEWGQGANLYLINKYDVLYVDYRGYGKSDGKISSEDQLIQDSQKVYEYLKEHYKEEDIIVSGTSIGSGIATQIAMQNKPKKLLLNSPYSSLESLIKEKVKIIPGIVIKYKLRTETHLKESNLPISIFHGDKDELIPIQHALTLKKLYPTIDLHVLEGYGHNDITQSPKFILEMKNVLNGNP